MLFLFFGLPIWMFIGWVLVSLLVAVMGEQYRETITGVTTVGIFLSICWVTSLIWKEGEEKARQERIEQEREEKARQERIEQEGEWGIMQVVNYLWK